MLHVQQVQRAPASQVGKKNIAIIGCGPTGLYLLKNIIDIGITNVALTFFSATENLGQGMPYDPAWVGDETLANIACEEIPDLVVPPHEWLAVQSDEWLAGHTIRRAQIGPAYIPTRRILGEYFVGQFAALVEKSGACALPVQCLVNVQVGDIKPLGERGFDVVFHAVDSEHEQRLSFDKVVLATGHEWPSEFLQWQRYLSSPWPITALTSLDAKTIGIIGSSLSAVDVCLTLARQNGRFARDFDGQLEYVPDVEVQGFKIVMHSRRGLLPSQRFHFEYPRIQVHQYISEGEIREHIAQNDGFLSLDFIYEKSLKETIAVKSASLHAQIVDMDLKGFVAFIYRRRQHPDQFEFLRREYAVSFTSIRNREPIFWKEILDDVAYTLNFYAKYLSRHDFERARDRLMPLVSHIVAFLPQQSCEQLLALHGAGCLSHSTIYAGWAVTEDRENSKLMLSYSEPDKDERKSAAYDMIVDCRGQHPAPFEKFPFASLSRKGLVVPARIGSRRGGLSADDNVVPVGGVDVDDQFRSIGSTGEANDDLFVLAAPHIHGLYPYHSGLPFCNEATKIVARTICKTQDVLK